MKETIQWTNLTLDEIAELMTAQGVEVSRHIVKQLLIHNGYKKEGEGSAKLIKWLSP